MKSARVNELPIDRLRPPMRIVKDLSCVNLKALWIGECMQNYELVDSSIEVLSESVEVLCQGVERFGREIVVETEAWSAAHADILRRVVNKEAVTDAELLVVETCETSTSLDDGVPCVPLIRLFWEARRVHDLFVAATANIDVDDIDDHIDEKLEAIANVYARFKRELLIPASNWSLAHRWAEDKLACGELLNADEFDLLRRCPSCIPAEFGDFPAGVPAYSAYRLMHVDDGHVRGMVGTAKHEQLISGPAGTRIVLFRVDPEDVRIDALSDAQRAFFSEHFPAELSRMRREPVEV